MGFASTHTDKNQETAPRSHFQPTICLTDWWLVNAENDFQGSRLAVAGFSYSEKQAMRVFSSAPILKRYDAFTLENSDGICVILDGFINKTRTVENGFPSDIFDHFVFGFPPYWKEYDEKFLQKSEKAEQNDDEKNTTRVPKKKGRPRHAPAAADNQKHKACADEYHLSDNKTSGAKIRGKWAAEAEQNDDEKNTTRVPKTRGRPCRTPAAADNLKHKARGAEYHLSDNKTSGVNIRGKLAAEAEQNDDEKNTTRVPKTRGRPRSAPVAADNQKRKACADEDHLSDNKTSGVKTRRKLAYETPVRERENISGASYQVSSRSGASTEVPVTRSRSGRLLMPALQFWCNQRAIYDVDRTVTEIRGVAHP